MAPNFFDYATKELEQDAFVCWLLAWADARVAAADAVLHQAGASFLNSVLALHGEQPAHGVTVKITRQRFRADIVAEVGQDLIVLIEDKVHAGLHGSQLDEYKRKCIAEFPDRRILPTFLKTGDQSDFAEVYRAGYKIVLREDILRCLAPYQHASNNAILADFLTHMQRRQTRIEAYRGRAVESWDRDAWKGFYKRLQDALPDLSWDYVPNPKGGFFGAWWGRHNWTDEASGASCLVYLQIEQGPLCFKINVNSEVHRAGARNRWQQRLLKAARAQGVPLVIPRRLGNGAYMTVGRLDPADWMIQQSGLVDVQETLNKLGEAMSLVTFAARGGTSLGPTFATA